MAVPAGAAPDVVLLAPVEALAAEAPLPATPAETLVATFERYLTAERGLAGSTIAAYTYVARLFLASDAVGGDAVLDGLTAALVTEFVLAETAERKVGSAKFVACGLRAFLRFAFVTGRTAIELDAAVPKIASWRLSGVPRALTQPDVARLVGSCDRRSRTGRRDHAVLLLMARLGLRAGEVARLGLDDIDWRAGEITVRGKANRVERVPLPAEVGESIAGWLQRGRPCTDRTVFSTVRAPHRPLSSGAVSGIVTAAGARAGLGHVNAHRLRHGAATAMLQGGANLAEIGQVLRHASVATTAIYAKVDDRSLRPLALPWPIGAHS
ncbi:MAG: site-specific integrase [Acidimicrobiia bacterium]